MASDEGNEVLKGVFNKVCASLKLFPVNQPIEPNEEPVYEVSLTSNEELNSLKALHHSHAIRIETPGILGFVDYHEYPLVVQLVIGADFEQFASKFMALKKSIIELDKAGCDLLLRTVDKTYLVHRFKSGSEPDKIFNYLMTNTGRAIPFKTVKLESDTVNYPYPSSELLRNSGLSVLKDYFFPLRSKQQIKILKKALIDSQELAKVTKVLSEWKS